MPKPIAVLISDIHYTLATLKLADTSLRLALKKAEELRVPLIDAGDTLDTKSIIRAECMNALTNTLKDAKAPVYVLVGNHTLMNERSTEHSLGFLKPYVNVVDAPLEVNLNGTKAYLIPYISDKHRLGGLLETIKPGSLLIMHQGVRGADMGHYVKDDSSLPAHHFLDKRVVSGHYHKRQDLMFGSPKPGNVGIFSYIGNPYTLNFGESDHPSKGFQILMDDGSLEFVPTNLRKHVVIEYEYGATPPKTKLGPQDPVWVKFKGPKSIISDTSKNELAETLGIGHLNFKLDLINSEDSSITGPGLQNLSNEQVLDTIIDETNEPKLYKQNLKTLWRDLYGQST